MASQCGGGADRDFGFRRRAILSSARDVPLTWAFSEDEKLERYLQQLCFCNDLIKFNEDYG